MIIERFAVEKAEALRIKAIADKFISEHPKPEILSIFTQVTKAKDREIFIDCANANCISDKTTRTQVVDIYHAQYEKYFTHWAFLNNCVDKELEYSNPALLKSYYEKQEQLAITTLYYAQIGKEDHTFSDEDGKFIETELNEENLLKAFDKINLYKDANGLIFGVKAKTLVVAEPLRSVAIDLVKSINERYDLKLNVVVSNHLIEDVDWFIITDLNNGLIHYTAKDIYSDCDLDENTLTIKLRVKGEYAFAAHANCLFYAKGARVDE